MEGEEEIPSFGNWEEMIMRSFFACVVFVSLYLMNEVLKRGMEQIVGGKCSFNSDIALKFV